MSCSPEACWRVGGGLATTLLIDDYCAPSPPCLVSSDVTQRNAGATPPASAATVSCWYSLDVLEHEGRRNDAANSEPGAPNFVQPMWMTVMEQAPCIVRVGTADTTAMPTASVKHATSPRPDMVHALVDALCAAAGPVPVTNYYAENKKFTLRETCTLRRDTHNKRPRLSSRVTERGIDVPPTHVYVLGDCTASAWQFLCRRAPAFGITVIRVDVTPRTKTALEQAVRCTDYVDMVCTVSGDGTNTAAVVMYDVESRTAPANDHKHVMWSGTITVPVLMAQAHSPV